MPFLDEIAAYLIAQNIGVGGSNIFLGSRANIPAGDGPLMTLIETGGSAPGRVHNDIKAHWQRPTAQITVRAKTYPPARAMAKAAYDLLDGVWNTQLGTTMYIKITARQEPTDVGLDDAGRVMIAFNIDAEKQPS